MDDGLRYADDVMLRGAVMSASMAMAITDPSRFDNPIVFANPAFSRLTGYAFDDLVGRNCRFLQGPDTNPAAVATIRDALSEAQEIQVDILNYRKDGSPFTNRLFISPVLNGRGEIVHYFASQLDATELIREDAVRRRRENILRYLAGELNQRLNTTMNVVQAVVRNTLASASSVLEATDALSARLVSLGQVHRHFSEKDWDEEDFEALVRQVVEPFQHHFAAVVIAGPPLLLNALLGLKMASAVYELASHSCQTTGAARTLEIRWTVSEPRATPLLQFEWHERGSARLDVSRKTKLHRALSIILNDPAVAVALRTDHEGGGLICRIEAPLR